MHELNRLHYLNALGIDSYVSRSQLPGAKPTVRLVISRRGPATLEPVPAEVDSTIGADAHRERPPLPEISHRRAGDSVPRRRVASEVTDHSPTRFSLSTVVAGDWLWVEDLQGMPLAREQVQLIQSMANALRVKAGNREASGQTLDTPQISQFDWPIHTNQQLDLGEDAARTAVAGFICRKVEQHNLGLVLLGTACQPRIPLGEMSCPWVAVPHGSGAMLADPSLKKSVWASLQSVLS